MNKLGDETAIIWEGDKNFTQKGQEETFIRFTVKKDGTVEKNSIRNLEKSMVLPTAGEYHSAPRPEGHPSVETIIGSGDEDGDVQNIPEGYNLDDAAGGF